MVNGESDEDEDIEEDTWDDEIPPPMLPHTKASKTNHDYAPINLTDNIIENAEKGNGLTDSPFLGSRGVSSILRSHRTTTRDSKFVNDLEAKIDI